MKTIAFVTSSEFPGIAEDDKILARQLEDCASCVGAAWDSPSIDWTTFDAIVVRSCWNYHTTMQQFILWVNRIRESAVVLNPPDLLLWNMNKRYLNELSGNGVPIPATVWLPKGTVDSGTISEIMRKNKWDRAVLKPCVSASSFQTSLVDRNGIGPNDSFLEFGDRDMMLQEFLAPIVDNGELSLIFLSGEFSHAVMKKAKPGDFRVQHQFGGSSEKVDVSARLISDCKRILDLLPVVPLYARVDGVMVNNTFTLMELELIEPVLFFQHAPKASLKRMAATLIKLLD